VIVTQYKDNETTEHLLKRRSDRIYSRVDGIVPGFPLPLRSCPEPHASTVAIATIASTTYRKRSIQFIDVTQAYARTWSRMNGRAFGVAIMLTRKAWRQGRERAAKAVRADHLLRFCGCFICSYSNFEIKTDLLYQVPNARSRVHLSDPANGRKVSHSVKMHNGSVLQ